MKLLTELDSLDNVKDGETRKLVTKATSSGSGNVVSSVSVSGDTITYTKGVTALTAHQNAFSNVKVGSTTVAADSAGDTLELVAGSNVTLTPDATNDKVTIAATDTTYESKAAASGGTAVSLVTTGEKYTWNNKQNALSTQTAYSAKGTATKVPQITTNTLGQVTKIEEVTITQPTVNNGTLTIQKNGTNVQTFSANQSSNATANITVPTKTSDLTNDSNYITNTGSTSGNAGTATILKCVDSNTTTGTSTWTNYDSDNKTVVWGQQFKKTAYNNDTGDISLSLEKVNDSTSRLNMSLDGKVVASSGFQGNLNGTAAKATGDKNGNDITTTYYKASNPNGYTSNTGTITGITMNGASKGTSGVVDLGTVLTSHQSIKTINNNTMTGTGNVSVGTITGVSVNGTSVATSGVANITSMPASILSGAIPSAVTATTQSASDNSTKIATTAFVKTAIDNLPEPMVFKGTLGTGGTITALPTNGTASVGDTYKVITAGTYASKAAKVGDIFICLTKTSSANTWELIPSGDEPSGTVTSVKIEATGPIAVNDSSAITTSGTRTISHANSGVTAGTYRSVTVNATGHVTAGTNPTTLSGYGITDAKIASGVITLGSNSITPLTASSTLDATKVSGTLPTSTYTDTKNTAGSTDSSSKLFLIGATSQAANPQTYSQDTAYVDTNGHLYSNSKQVVNLSDTQALTNKTYNGYTLAAACAKAVVTSIDTSASLPTSNAVKTFVEGKGYVLKSGDTMTGALNFANNVANKVGDDVSFGDFNKAGTLGIIGQNGTTGIALIKNGSTWGASAERAEMVYNSTDKCIEFNFA